MELLLHSVRNVFFGFIVLLINIPIFWSFTGALEFLKSIARIIGVGV
jgi:hypothetical protein